MLTIGRKAQHLLDEAWTHQTGLPLLLLMEQAATAVCHYCLSLIAPSGRSLARVLVLAGKGQNGGDAYACARLLQAEGLTVDCCEVFPGEPLPAEASLNREAWLRLGNTLWPAADLVSVSATGCLSADRPPLPVQPGPDVPLHPALQQADLIIDGIFGTGFRVGRPLPEIVTTLTAALAIGRKAGSQLIAIDIPSGVDADSGAVAVGAIEADATVTFVRPKTGLIAAPGRFNAGHLVTASIGVSERMLKQVLAQESLPEIIDAPLVKSWCLPRRPDGHKGRFGRALLLGGSPGLAGAICLAGTAAARAGTGLVYLGVSSSVASLVLPALPEALLTSIPDGAAESRPGPLSEQPAGPRSERPDARQAESLPEQLLAALLLPLIAGKQAVAIGPGAGQAGWLETAMQLALEMAPALVLDADALNHLARQMPVWQERFRQRNLLQPQWPWPVLTPHPGEFSRLAPDIDQTDRQAAARELASRLSCVVILKGASTVVADPAGRTYINLTGHEGLAKGGSGDVLCGLLTGLLAQGLPVTPAAAAAVYLHGLAADLAAIGRGHRAMLPGDVLQAIGQAFQTAGWENPAGQAEMEHDHD